MAERQEAGSWNRAVGQARRHGSGRGQAQQHAADGPQAQQPSGTHQGGSGKSAPQRDRGPPNGREAGPSWASRVTTQDRAEAVAQHAVVQSGSTLLSLGAQQAQRPAAAQAAAPRPMASGPWARPASDGRAGQGPLATPSSPLVSKELMPPAEHLQPAKDTEAPDGSTGSAPAAGGSSWAARLAARGLSDTGSQPVAQPVRRAVQLTPEEELRRQAHLSRLDPATGKLKCLACNKAMPSYPALMQHLKDKHRGVNSIAARFFDVENDEPPRQQQVSRSQAAGPVPRQELSLFDFLAPKPAKAAPKKDVRKALVVKPTARRDSAMPTGFGKPSARISAVVQASELNGAGIGLGGGAGTTGRLVLRGAKKKRQSTLKRIILKERADKALAQARAAYEAAQQRVQEAELAERRLRTDLESALAEARGGAASGPSGQGHKGSGLLGPHAFTKIQVLEVGVAAAKKSVAAARSTLSPALQALESAKEKHRKAYKIPDQKPKEEPALDTVGGPVAVVPVPVFGWQAGGHTARAPPSAPQVQRPTPAGYTFQSLQSRQVGSLSFFSQTPAQASDSDSDDDVALPGFENALSSWMSNLPKVSSESRPTTMMPPHHVIQPATTPIQPPVASLAYATVRKQTPPARAVPTPQPGGDQSTAQAARPSIPGSIMDRYMRHITNGIAQSQAAVAPRLATPSPAVVSAVSLLTDLTGPGSASSSDDDDDDLGFEDTLSKWTSNASLGGFKASTFQRPVLPAAAASSSSPARVGQSEAGDVHAMDATPSQSTMLSSAPAPTPRATTYVQRPAQPPAEAVPQPRESHSDSDSDDGEGYTDVMASWITNVSSRLAPMDSGGGLYSTEHPRPIPTQLQLYYGPAASSSQAAATLPAPRGLSAKAASPYWPYQPPAAQAEAAAPPVAAPLAHELLRSAQIPSHPSVPPQQPPEAAGYARRPAVSTPLPLPLPQQQRTPPQETVASSVLEPGQTHLLHRGIQPHASPAPPPHILGGRSFAAASGPGPRTPAHLAAAHNSPYTSQQQQHPNNPTQLPPSQPSPPPRPAPPAPAWSAGRSFTSIVKGQQPSENGATSLQEMQPENVQQASTANGDGDGNGNVMKAEAKAPKRRRAVELTSVAEELGLVEDTDIRELQCTVCSITVHGMAALKLHLQGRRHLNRVKEMASSLASSAEPYRPAVAVNALPSGPPPAPPATGAKGSKPKTYIGPDASTREYCEQVITPELNTAVDALLRQLLVFQERAMLKSTAKAKKRLLSGLREVAKAIKLHKAHSVVVAPNIECVESEGGLDDRLQNILNLARENNVPVVFALNLKKLGQVFGRRKKMSAIAVLDVNGVHAEAEAILRLAAQGRAEWEELQTERNRKADPGEARPSSPAGAAVPSTSADGNGLPSAPAVPGDSRGPDSAADSQEPKLNPQACSFVPSWLSGG